MEGNKFDNNKLDWTLLPASIEELVKVCNYGANKYGRDNWKHGLKFSRIFSAIIRHLYKWWWHRENNDRESGLNHLAHAAWGCLVLLDYSRDNYYDHFDDGEFNKEINKA